MSLQSKLLSKNFFFSFRRVNDRAVVRQVDYSRVSGCCVIAMHFRKFFFFDEDKRHVGTSSCPVVLLSVCSNCSTVMVGHSLPEQADEGTEFNSLQCFQTQQTRLHECKKPQGLLPSHVYAQYVPIISSQRKLYVNLVCNF